MTRTTIGNIKEALEQAALKLAVFDDFRSPVNYAAARLLFETCPGRSVLRVAVREEGTGTFYRGRVWSHTVKSGGEGTFTILTDDGEHVNGVEARAFVSLRLEDVS